MGFLWDERCFRFLLECSAWRKERPLVSLRLLLLLLLLLLLAFRRNKSKSKSKSKSGRRQNGWLISPRRDGCALYRTCRHECERQFLRGRRSFDRSERGEMTRQVVRAGWQIAMEHPSL